MAKLCAVCRAAHANFLLRRTRQLDAVTVFFSWLRSRSTSRCPLCRLFRKTTWGSTPVILPPDSTHRFWGEIQLPATSENGYLECMLGFSSDLKPYHAEEYSEALSESLVGVFVDWSRTSKGGADESQGFARIEEKTVNFELLRQWLQECNRCAPQTNAWQIDHDKTRRASVGLNLVDCRSRRVVQADWSHRFAAISYVWGEPSSQKSNGRTAGLVIPYDLPKSLPKLVEDAISVTLKMGLEFLWIDRFCVEKDEAVKHQQIAAMDQVYSVAAFTIIAAVGQSGDEGLHGVSEVRKGAPFTVDVGQFSYVQIKSDPLKRFRCSKYQHRGWTYQEYILSSHCFIFEEDQVVFQCRNQGHTKYEAVTLPCVSIAPRKEHLTDDEIPILDRRLLSYIVSNEEQRSRSVHPKKRPKRRGIAKQKQPAPLEQWVRSATDEISDSPIDTDQTNSSESDGSSDRDEQEMDTHEADEAVKKAKLEEDIEDEASLDHQLQQIEDTRMIEELESEESFWAKRLMKYMAEEASRSESELVQMHEQNTKDASQMKDEVWDQEELWTYSDKLEDDLRTVEKFDEESLYWERRLDEHKENDAKLLEHEFSTAREQYEQRIMEQARIYDERRIRRELRDRDLYETEQEQEWTAMYEKAMEDRAMEWDIQSRTRWGSEIEGPEWEPPAWDYSPRRTPSPEPRESRIGFVLTVFEQHVKNYSSRQLTYSSDAMAAILSVLQLFSSAVPGFKTHYGVPFYFDPFETSLVKNRIYSLRFATGLCWSHGIEDLRSVVRRNPRFPSWSWLGWQGQIFNWGPNLSKSRIIASDSIFQEGVDFSKPDTERDLKSLKLISPPKLSIQARCWTLKFHWGRNDRSLFPDPSDEYLVLVRRDTADELSGFDHGYYMENPDNPLEEARLELSRCSIPGQDFHSRLCDETWIGVPLAVKKNDRHTPDDIYMLVVGRIRPKDGHLERIGIMVLPQSFLYDQMPQRRHFWLG